MIDEKEVTAYVTMPDCFLQGCSEDIVIFRADGGNHFTDYGIYEGMFLFFDRKKRFKKGRLIELKCPNCHRVVEVDLSLRKGTVKYRLTRSSNRANN